VLLSQWGGADGLLGAQPWDQGSPYNSLCPNDPVTHLDSYVGCVATAAAQIVNYWQFPTAIHFSAADSYTSLGVNGWIDIDSEANVYSFPTFADLDTSLAAITYDGSSTLKANLSLGVGEKFYTAYAASGIGSWALPTWGTKVFQNGLGYGSATWGLWDTPGVQAEVIQNIKDGQPVMLSVCEWKGIVPTNGHVLVLDGYDDSNNTFHVNLGWGPAHCNENKAGNWYSLPDIPTSLAHFNDAIIAVYDVSPYKGWSQPGSDAANSYWSPYAAIPDTVAVDKWKQRCSSDYWFTGMVVGSGNTVFAACDNRYGNASLHPSLWVVDQYGVKEREVVFSAERQSITPPVQASDGMIYVGVGSTGRIYRIDPNSGTAAAIFTCPVATNFASLKIDSAGFLYAGTDSALYCVSQSGALQWPYPLSGLQFFSGKTPAIDVARNRVYLTYYDFSTSHNYLAALDRSTGAVIQTRQDCGGVPSVAADGTVYVVGPTAVKALNWNDLAGLPKWTYTFTGASSLVTGNFAVSHAGAVYVPYKVKVGGTYTLGVRAIDANTGSQKWDVPFAGSMSDNILSVYIAKNDVVVFTLNQGSTFDVRAYQDAGTHADALWNRTWTNTGGDLAFGPGDTVYVIPMTGAGQTLWALASAGEGMGWNNNYAPLTPSNPTLPSGSLVNGTSATVGWVCSDPEANGLGYTVLVSRDNVEYVAASGIATTSWTLTNLVPGAQYAWQIIASDGQAVTNGPVWAFEVIGQPPVITGVSDDSGTSGDGITSDRRLLVSGTSAPGCTITVYLGASQVGTTTADGSGAWVFDYTGTSLADGQYAFTVTATLNNVSAPSSLYYVTVDGTAPTVSGIGINDGSAQRSRISRISIALSETAGVAPGKSVLTLQNLTTGATVDPTNVGFSYDAVSRIAAWDFSSLAGGTLPDGNYRATISGSQISDVAGNLLDGNGDGNAGDDYTFDFFRFFGDINGDRYVGFADLSGFRASYQKGSGDPLFNPALDANGDGYVGFADLSAFRANYQKSLPAGPHLTVTDTSGNASDQAVALADTQVGTTSATETFTLVNSGDQDLSVTSFAKGGSNPGDFTVTVKDNTGATVTGSSFAIPAGSSYTIQVMFAPTAAGARAATIVFNTDDGDAANAAVTLNMSGTATAASSDVLLRDDFSSTTPSAVLDPTKWTVFTDTGTWGPQGGGVTQTGDGWAHVAVASEWTGTGFYTTQTFANVGQYHIEGKVKFTRGTNNADNIFILIRNPDESLRLVDPYEQYQGPQVRFDIHPTHSPMQGGFTSVYVQTKSNAGWQSPSGTSNDIAWSGTSTVTYSIDYNADTGKIDFNLYDEDKTQVLTQGTFTLDAQTRADIGANFRVEMGMDGYNSADHYWDYVEVRRLPVFQDEFSSTTPNAPLDSTKWQVYTDTGNQGTQGGSVYRTGDGWAHVDVEPYWTGTGFYSAQTFANTGQYHIEAGLEFTRGVNNADNVFMLIRNADITTRENQYYMSYTGPQIRFNIHPTHSWYQDGHTSVGVRGDSLTGWQPVIDATNDHSWSGTTQVVMSLDYNAGTGAVSFRVYNSDKTSVLIEGSGMINSQVLIDIGSAFKLEFGMDGYNSSDHFWDYVRVYRTA
jgi:hypothetical protein